VSPSDTSVVKGAAFGLLLATGGPPSRHPAAPVYRPREAHERPPPTDLVVALQHFLI
jgi:hypothetical protein